MALLILVGLAVAPILWILGWIPWMAALVIELAVLFIAAMTAYVGALVCFLLEIFAAIETMRFGMPPEVRGGDAPASPASPAPPAP